MAETAEIRCAVGVGRDATMFPALTLAGWSGGRCAMLGAIQYVPATELDERLFAATVPEDHYLRRVQQAVDFSSCRDILAVAYCPGDGRPAVEPLLLLKLEFLQYHYVLSGRQVTEQARY